MVANSWFNFYRSKVSIMLKHRVDRRHFLKSSGIVAAGLGCAACGVERLLAAAPALGAINADKLGWRLGVQAFTFRLFPLYETIDKVASLGVRYLESGSGWSLTKDRPDVKFAEDAPAAVLSEVKKRLSDSGVTMISYWPLGFSGDIGQCRKTFEFAKSMGAEMLVGEPGEGSFDMLDRLCDEYQMNVAIHNHPKPSPNWSPDIVLKACQGRSKRIGACADTGHWMRSGLNPVESLKKLEGRIVSLHLKDLNKFGGDGHDAPWGTGVADVKAMLAELHRQRAKPIFVIEYEYNWENSLPEVALCVEYFNKVCGELAATT